MTPKPSCPYPTHGPLRRRWPRGPARTRGRQAPPAPVAAGRAPLPRPPTQLPAAPSGSSEKKLSRSPFNI